MERVIEARRREQERALAKSKLFAGCVREELGERMMAAIVFGSYARGDFNEWSDIDILVIVEELPRNPLKRLDLVEDRLLLAAEVEPLILTPKEASRRLSRRDPAIMEAFTRGILVVGEPKALEEIKAMASLRQTPSHSL